MRLKLILNGEEDNLSDGVSDTAILNVIRRSSEKVLTTSEIAANLPIGSDWTAKRLDDLEESGRIHSKPAGQAKVWWLDEDEVANPVAESQAGLLWYRFHINQASRFVAYAGLAAYGSAGLLLIPLILFNIEVFADSAILGAIIGSLGVLAGGAGHLIVMAMDRISE